MSRLEDSAWHLSGMRSTAISDGNRLFDDISRIIVSGLEKISRLVPAPALLRKILALKAHEIARSGDEYDLLIQLIEAENVASLPGDLIEIGAYMGVGTARLARFAKRYNKKLYSIDVFDVSRDTTETSSGMPLSDIYSDFLEKMHINQLEAYQFMTRGLQNIVTIPRDSVKVEFPAGQRFIFGFIDGNHSPEYVVNDFYLVWKHLTSMGMVAFDDYSGDIPQVTRTVDSLIGRHRAEIVKLIRVPPRVISLIKK